MELERQALSLEIKEYGQDDGYFRFSGYASTKDLDSYNDIVEPNAFNTFLMKAQPVMLWQHSHMEPIGIFDAVQADEYGVFVKGKLPLDDDFVKNRVVPQLKIGSVKSMSIGFRVIKAMTNEKGQRVIQEAELPEISLVTFPANDNARIISMKKAPLSYHWEPEAAKKRIGDEKGAVLPGTSLVVMDKIEGELQVIPKAVISARVAVAGLRHVEIADAETAKKHLNKLYDEMGLDEPFNEGKSAPFSKIEIEHLLKADLSAVLRRGQLTKGAAEYVAERVLGDQGTQQSGGTDDGEVKTMLQEIASKIKEVAHGY